MKARKEGTRKQEGRRKESEEEWEWRSGNWVHVREGEVGCGREGGRDSVKGK